MNTDSFSHARHEKRSSVRLYGQLKYMNSSLHCRVVDLSERGVKLLLTEPRPLTSGMPVEFQSDELGHLVGHVAWYQAGTVGVRLNHTTSTYAQVKSYFRFFHQETTPTLRG